MKNSQGVVEYFYFNVVPFGYCGATAVMGKLLRPIRIHLHDLSVDASYFVDDGANIGISFKRCDAYFDYTLFMISITGWEVAPEKSVQPSQIVLYLGFLLNTQEMRISAPIRKILKLQADIDNLVTAHYSGAQVPCKQSASVLGTCAHLLVSHGPALRIVTRESQHQLGVRVTEAGWKADMVITDRMVKELQSCKTYLETSNGQPIRFEAKTTTILAPVKKSYLLQDWDPTDSERKLITMVSDASDTRAFIYKADDFTIVEEYPFSWTESQASSTMRELSAINKLLTTDQSFLKKHRGMVVCWMTDSQALTHIMKRGSRVKELQDIVLKLFDLQQQWGKIFSFLCSRE